MAELGGDPAASRTMMQRPGQDGQGAVRREEGTGQITRGIPPHEKWEGEEPPEEKEESGRPEATQGVGGHKARGREGRGGYATGAGSGDHAAPLP